ncbi:NPL4 family-domain-containing protein [Lipomyces oligophaga]|uniref:NPL4 family-domain-containing protein n=1 Tax=Lipomyces oligophaga TaxID=45792 RepID=UPI0034CD7417
MIVRFRGPEGNYRCQVEPTDDFKVLIHKLEEQLPKHATAENIKFSEKPGNSQMMSVQDFVGRSLEALNIKHGDMLYISYPELSSEPSSDSRFEGTASTIPQQIAVRLNGKPITETDLRNMVASSVNDPSSSSKSVWETVKQDPVDEYLDKQDGKIVRKKDLKMCKHSDKGMCDYCMPLEPWDQNYLSEHGIKSASFHSYIRKLNASGSNANANTAAASSFVPPLSEADYQVKQKCPSGHPPWPQGICSKCQPSAITLQTQPFRMVDHVEFGTSSIVNDFIDNWRRSGTQAIGYMYGTYEPYSEVPLGTKAVVHAIVEPPQVTAVDGVTLMLPWTDEDRAKATAHLPATFQQVGVIFTDLTDDGTGTGSVVCKRHADSYFLSSLEIVFAATLQRQHPSATRWCDTGYFSSKFVSCVISGNEQGQIEINAYQVSNSAEAMVQADIIEPSVSPGLMLVKDADEKRYVPDVFFRRVNEYKVAVQENAKPVFPVEYLIVTLSHGFPAS